MAEHSDFDLLNVSDEDEDDVLSSDDEYAQRLQFQETLFSSLTNSQVASNDSSSSYLHLPSSSSSFPSSSSSLKTINACPTPETEHGRSSNETDESVQVICEICLETKRTTQMFENQTCHHSFCFDCVTKQVATKIQDRKSEVSCPGLDCKSVVELDACRPWLPKELVDKWDEALCEALFLGTPKFYCPFKDCSAMLLVEDEEQDQQAIREAECPFCHRLFCARCNVPWHAGIQCKEFQRLNEDERERDGLLVRELANKKKWRRCPRCKFYVEKTDGCLHITCRCRYEFCYRCGKQWTSIHAGCRRN